MHGKNGKGTVTRFADKARQIGRRMGEAISNTVETFATGEYHGPHRGSVEDLHRRPAGPVAVTVDGGELSRAKLTDQILEVLCRMAPTPTVPSAVISNLAAGGIEARPAAVVSILTELHEADKVSRAYHGYVPVGSVLHQFNSRT